MDGKESKHRGNEPNPDNARFPDTRDMLSPPPTQEKQEIVSGYGHENNGKGHEKESFWPVKFGGAWRGD